MSGWNAALRTAFHQEPIILWSCAIGAVGIILPVVVPPIRERFYKPDVRNPPPFKQLVESASQAAKS